MKLDRVIAVRNNKTIFRDGDACIKVFNDDYSKAAVIYEALNQARAEETGLNVPHVREIITVDGKWAIVSEYIKGKTLEQLMKEDGENKDKYIEMLAELQIQVNSKSNPDFVRLKDKMNKEICQSELDATIRFDFHNRLEDMPKHSNVCHGDFIPSNIIVTDEGKAYIVDWSNASQGNASADAAMTYLYFLMRSDREGAKKYLDAFCEKSDTAAKYVYKWMPLVAASRSVKGSLKERDFLLSLVNNSDY